MNEKEWLEYGDSLIEKATKRIEEIEQKRRENDPDWDSYTSEFGAGLVVPLVKFTEHLGNGASVFSEGQIYRYAEWVEMPREEKNRIMSEAVKYPHGDSATLLREMESIELTKDIWKTPEKHISHLIEMWANGASDHFADLDREKAPACLCELADLTWAMGHGFTDRIWTLDDLKHMRKLWKESCIALDEMLGTKPDWGQW